MQTVIEQAEALWEGWATMASQGCSDRRVV